MRSNEREKIAYSVLPTRFEDDRHGAIERGCRAIGFKIVHGYPRIRVKREDILLTWTVFKGIKEKTARDFERAGGRVVVCEEAYFRQVNGQKNFALALGEHCGGGQWNYHDDDRWDSFNIPLCHWRDPGSADHILVTEQRGIGSSAMGSPANWHEDVKRRLEAITKRPVIVRYHPRTRTNRPHAATQPSAEEQLEKCHAVVTWSSAFGVHALVAGVPVFYEAPHFIVSEACENDIGLIENPKIDDDARRNAFNKLAWAQWSRSEIENGHAFDCLLRRSP